MFQTHQTKKPCEMLDPKNLKKIHIACWNSARTQELSLNMTGGALN